MMKSILQILLLVTPLFCRSQQQTIDSLQQLLLTATTDSARYRTTYYIGFNYVNTHYDSALYYTNKALLLAQKNGKKLNEAESLYIKGFLLSHLQRLPQSFQSLTAALQIAEDPRNENSFWNIRKPQVKDKDYRLRTLASIHNALGLFMLNVDRIDQTVYHYNESIKMFRAIGDSLDLAITISNLGGLYWKSLNEPDSALLLEQAAESIYVRKKVENRLGAVYAIMGASYIAKHNDSLALAYLYKALSIDKKYDDQRILAVIYRALADFYVQKNNKDSSLYYARMAANIHIPLLPLDPGDDFEKLARSYALNHQQDSAYKYQGIALTTYDSLYKNRIKGLTGFQQLSFDQQQQLQQLEADKIAVQNRTRMYTLFAGLSLAILISFFLYRNSQQQKKANLLLQQQKEEIDNKNKELEIETSLERVRAEMMAMHKSEDLRQVVASVFKQLQHLGFDAPACALIIFNKDVAAEHWMTGFSHDVYPKSYTIPYNEHPYFTDLLHAWQQGVPFQEFLFEGDLKVSYAEWLFEHSDFKYLPEAFKQEVKSPARTVISDAFMQYGMLEVISAESLPEEKVNIIKRFAKVFEQTYTRFLDILKAEAQAREAQIEAALERVRSRSMAMQKSEELREVIQIIFDQLYGLHFYIDSANFLVEVNETNDLRNWLAAPGLKSASRIDIPYIDHPIFTRLAEAKEKGEAFYTLLLGKEKKDQFFDHYYRFASIPEERKSYVYNGKGWGQSMVLMKNIALSILNYAGIPYSEEENKTLVRFAKVFEQTYTRFLDLQKAEASAKDAVKQASIDRVRAEIASMRTTNDLDRIIPLIWNELTILHIPFIRCGVFIVNEGAQQTHVYLSTPEGKAIAAFQLPFDSKGLNEEMLQYWRNNQIFKDHWDAGAFSAWTHSLLESGAIQPDEHYSNEQPPENLYLHFVPFMQGMLYVGNTAPLSADELSLIESLADAFSTAYARYEDFSKLEAAKQQIETTLTELKSTQSQLIQKEKMASLGELTAGIAHEIQNPLNFINNFSEVNKELLIEMKEEIDKGDLEEVKLIVDNVISNEEKISHHGKRADSIVKGMLQHSKASTGKRELTDINALIDESLRLSYHGLRAKDKSFNAVIKTDFNTSIGKVNIIPQDISRVLLNLFNNAFYAVNEKKAKLNGMYEPAVSVCTKKLDGKVEIHVKDNGNGIPPNIVDKIFQPFFTTKPTGQGTGLGLSLSYDIIKAHGGEIRVESKEGEGSDFIIKLPLA